MCFRLDLRRKHICSDDMIKIKGANVFPSQVEAVLREIEGTEPSFQIVLDRKGTLDELTVLVEVSESIFFDQMKKQREFIDLIRDRLADELGISVEIKLVDKKSLERFEGKTKRVIERRNV